VRPVDVNHSVWEHTLEKTGTGDAVRLGLSQVKGLSKNAVAALIHARTKKGFSDIGDLQQRAGLSALQMANLIAADALRVLSGHRHQSHWQARAIQPATPLMQYERNFDDDVQLRAPSEIQDIAADYNSLRLSLKRHPMLWLRERYAIFESCKKHSELITLGQSRFVRVAGLVTGRQRPGTETGIIFLTLEDETGNTNVIVREDVQLRCREALLKAQIMLVKGVIETVGEGSQCVVHVLAGELLDCSHYLRDMEVHSRDFH